MGFSAEQWVILIGAVGAVVVQIIQAWRTSAKVDRIDRKADAARAIGAAKLSEVHTQTEIIERQGNSAAARAQGQIDTLRREVDVLRASLNTSQQTAAVLAAKSDKV